MPDVIEPAKSGRSNCRGCGRKIPQGGWRFGESLQNPYAEGESLVWYHLGCAAYMRPEKLGPALEASGQKFPDLDWLRPAVSEGLAHPRLMRLARAERAPSGSAHCRHCRELVSKGSWRLALQLFEEGRMQSIGTIHAECAAPYFGTEKLRDRIGRLTEGLTSTDLDVIEGLVQSRAPTASDSYTERH